MNIGDVVIDDEFVHHLPLVVKTYAGIPNRFSIRVSGNYPNVYGRVGRIFRVSFEFALDEDAAVRMIFSDISVSDGTPALVSVQFTTLDEMVEKFVDCMSWAETPNESYGTAIVYNDVDHRTFHMLEHMNVTPEIIQDLFDDIERHLNIMYARTFTNLNTCPLMK